MGEKGQNFVVKQAAKQVDGLNVDDAIAMLAKVTSGEVESPAKKGLKGVAKASMAREKPMSATSLLMKGVEAAALEREKAAQLKMAQANEVAGKAGVAAEGSEAAGCSVAPTGTTPGANRPKKLSFGEYMARSGAGGTPEGKAPASTPPRSSNCEATMARVRGTAGPTGSVSKPVPARLSSSGSPSSLRRSASSSKVQPTPSPPGRAGRPSSEADAST